MFTGDVRDEAFIKGKFLNMERHMADIHNKPVHLKHPHCGIVLKVLLEQPFGVQIRRCQTSF